MKRNIMATVIVAMMLINPFNGYTCSSFTVKVNKSFILCKSLDWSFGSGILIQNNRGTQRYSIPVGKNMPTFSWTSKYGSLTVNQYGQFLPDGGMNEKGFAMEEMTLRGSVHEKVGNGKHLNEVQYIQYCLDNFATVKEALEGIKDIEIVKTFQPLHYFISDPSGDSAIIEFINGKRVITTGKDLPIRGITNTSQADAHKDGRYQVLLANIKEPLNTKKGQKQEDVCYDILEKVKLPHTKWQIAFDMTKMCIHFRTVDAMHSKTVQMSDFDFAEKSKIKFIDINVNHDITYADFKNFKTFDNYKVMQHSFKMLGLPIPDEAIKALAEYTIKGIENKAVEAMYNQILGMLP